MPEATVNSVRLHYQRTGRGPDLVMLHGLTVDQRMWEPQVADLSKDFRVTTYDARGHGKSEVPPTGYSTQDYSEDLYQLLQHLNIARAHLVGRSVGATTVFHFALEHPDMVASLVVANGTPASGPPPAGAPRGGIGGPQVAELARSGKLKEALDLWSQAPAFADIAKMPHVWAKLKPMLLEYSGITWTDPKAGTYPVPNDLEKAGQIKAPTLFVWSERDFPNLIQALEKAMSMMPRARKAVIPNAGAIASMEQPEAFNRSLRDFYASIGAVPTRP